MGKPGTRNGVSLRSEKIGPVEGTRGIETSQYPEEKKENSNPPVAASEKGSGQTVSVSYPGGVADTGLWDSEATHQSRHRVTKLQRRRAVWKGRPQWVIAPYPKRSQPLRFIPSNAGTEQTGVNPRGPPRKPNYYLATDSELVP